MDPILALSLTLVALFVLILLRVPIAFALLGAGAVGLVAQEGPQVAMSVISNQPYNSVASFTLIVIPLFIAVGVFAKQTGVAEATYGFLSKYLKGLPGGLGVATIVASAAFGTVSGSSTATTATIGKISIEEMIREGYPPKFAGAIVASGGTLGILIPPSIALVLYGVMTGESISSLFMAGIIPGILSALVLAVTIIVRMVWWKRRGAQTEAQKLATEAVQVARETASEDEGFFAKQTQQAQIEEGGGASKHLPDLKISNIAAVGIVVTLFLVIIGGLYTGILTATEAAGVGAAVALLFMMVVSFLKDGRNTGRRIIASLKETSAISGMIFAIFIGAGMFNYLLVSGRIPHDLADQITDWNVPPAVVVILLLLILLPLGMILDGNAMLLILVPLSYPIVTELGFDGIWFGILFIKMIEIGLLTPPVGLNAFVVAGVSKEVTAGQVFKGVWLFMVIDLLLVAVLFMFPEITLFLPGLAH